MKTEHLVVVKQGVLLSLPFIGSFLHGPTSPLKAPRDDRDCCRELSLEMEQKIRNNQKVTIKTDYLTCRWSNETHLK